MPHRRLNQAVAHLALLLVLTMPLALFVVAVHAGSTSDLTVESIWLEDASQPGQLISQVSSAQSFLIVATVKNIGQETASGYYIDVYYDSDYGRGGPDNILAGEVQTWYVGPLTAQDGAHTTRWVLDPDNLITELNENNNEKGLTFTVGASQTPSPTLTLSPTSGRVGTVVSTSGSNYRGTTCQLTATPSNLFSSSTCSISSGALTGSFTVDQNAPAGAYTVTAQSNLGQSDSATNTFTVSLTVSMTYAVTFYTDPASGTVSVDGVTKVNGAVGSGYSLGQRVHVVASQLSGYTFTNWEANGVTMDSLLSQDTYMTVSTSGWVKAHYAPPTVTQTVTVTSTVAEDSSSTSAEAIMVTTTAISTVYSTSTTTYLSTVTSTVTSPVVTETETQTLTSTVAGSGATSTVTETQTVTVTQTLSGQSTSSTQTSSITKSTPTVRGTTITITQVTGASGSVTVKGILKDASGNGLPRLSLRVTVDGRYQGRLITGSGGSFTYYGLGPTVKGAHLVTVWFDGTTQYASSSASRSYYL